MDGAFYSGTLGRECDLSAVAGDVSGAGGDGGTETGADDGCGDNVCVDLFESGGIGYAKAVSGPSADFDVYTNDSDIRDHSRPVVAGVSAGDE